MLKGGRLPENVISEMVRRCAKVDQQQGLAGDDSSADPRARHSPGIYMMADWLPQPKPSVLRPSKASGVKVSGNRSILFPCVSKNGLSGHQQPNRVSKAIAQFLFTSIVPTTKSAVLLWEVPRPLSRPMNLISSTLKVKGSERELVTGKMTAYSGSRGLDSKYTLPVTTTEMFGGIFRVSGTENLAPGEYALIFKGASGGARIYDFSIK
jgi:hypothetical protein